MRVCPAGCVCQAVRAHGVNVTSAELKVRAVLGLNSGLTLTLPVKVSADPSVAGRFSVCEISIVCCARASSTICIPFRSLSPGGVAAVDRQCDSDDEAGAGAAQPQHGRGDLLRLTEPVDRLVGDRFVGVQFTLVDHGGDHRGGDGAGAYGVDPDAARRVFERGAAGEAKHAMFGG